MKKFILVISFLFSFVIYFSVIFPHNSYAAPGNICTNAGGNCRTTCLRNENDWGAQDCPQGGVAGGKTCCGVTNLPTPSTAGGIPIPLPSCSNLNEVRTALGCIPTGPTEFVTWVLRIAIGLGGGIAFLLMIFGGIKILTSSGNPEGVKSGTETITSALTGLVFIILSLFLLKLIGVDLLQIPGFGMP